MGQHANVGTVDGQEWEVYIPQTWWPLAPCPEWLEARPSNNSDAEFNWKIRTDQIVYVYERED